jgi:two-component system chemotaxis sensor kinase CheA
VKDAQRLWDNARSHTTCNAEFYLSDNRRDSGSHCSGYSFGKNEKRFVTMGIYQQLESDFDYEIVEEFLGHYTIMVESMDRLIVNLKDPACYSNNINELFRMFHTIKSASAYLHITPVHKLVTLGEDVLEECRNIKGAASDDLINWLLLISEQLTLYKEDLELDHDNFSKLNTKIIKIPTNYLRS